MKKNSYALGVIFLFLVVPAMPATQKNNSLRMDCYRAVGYCGKVINRNSIYCIRTVGDWIVNTVENIESTYVKHLSDFLDKLDITVSLGIFCTKQKPISAGKSL